MVRGDSGVLEDEYEFEQNIKAYAASSSRVRYVVVAVLVASIMVFSGYRNSILRGWTNSRLILARAALYDRVYEHDIESRIAGCVSEPSVLSTQAGASDSCTLMELAREWAVGHGLQSEKAIESRLALLESIQVGNIITFDVPILGIKFDVNDLGIFSGIAFIVLGAMLCFSMARQHDNLYLCSWKICEVHDREGRPDDGHSSANLLYHALAMAQLFAKPPTLARWRCHGINRCAKMFMVAPALIQALIFFHDLKTIQFGMMLNARGTVFGVCFEASALVVIGILFVCCWLYSRADDMIWRDVFFYINPSWKRRKQRGWFKWVWSMTPTWKRSGPMESLGVRSGAVLHGSRE